jgi:glycosyltransferase involved in cell wall biosynthesis
MRVTHIITRLIIGGAQENTIGSVLGLRGKPGLHVDLIAGPTVGPEGSLEGSVSGVPELLTITPHLVRPLHPWKDALALTGLTQLLRQHAPDVVHTHSGKAGILGRLAARRAGAPVIVHSIHGPSFGPFQGALTNLLFTSAERWAARFTTHFVSVANAMTEQYLAAGVGTRAQFTRIFSGFDLAPFVAPRNDPAVRTRYGLGPDDFVVGKIARLAPLKGHEDLLTAAPELVRRCPRMKFLLVGDGKWRDRFERRVRELNLGEHVKFAGLVQPDEMPGLIGAMDLVVHLSYREGLPRALPQALAAGRPVIAYDCDGAREICRTGETGFLVRAGDVGQFRDCVLALASNAKQREEFGRRGQDFVRQWFSIERMIDELYLLYQRLSCERLTNRSGTTTVTSNQRSDLSCHSR